MASCPRCPLLPGSRKLWQNVLYVHPAAQNSAFSVHSRRQSFLGQQSQQGKVMKILKRNNWKPQLLVEDILKIFQDSQRQGCLSLFEEVIGLRKFRENFVKEGYSEHRMYQRDTPSLSSWDLIVGQCNDFITTQQSNQIQGSRLTDLISIHE